MSVVEAMHNRLSTNQRPSSQTVRWQVMQVIQVVQLALASQVMHSRQSHLLMCASKMHWRVCHKLKVLPLRLQARVRRHHQDSSLLLQLQASQQQQGVVTVAASCFKVDRRHQAWCR